MQSQLSIPFPTPVRQPIRCRVSVRNRAGVTLLGITSPRTGVHLEVRREKLAGVGRIAGKIVCGISRGMTATFTADELRAFHAAFRQQIVRYIRHCPAWR